MTRQTVTSLSSSSSSLSDSSGMCDCTYNQQDQNIFNLFIYLGFYVTFNTVQVISRRVVGRAEETSTYSLLGFCTVNCRPTASNYQLSHLRPCQGSNPGLRGGRRECYHSATVAPKIYLKAVAYLVMSCFCCTVNIYLIVYNSLNPHIGLRFFILTKPQAIMCISMLIEINTRAF